MSIEQKYKGYRIVMYRVSGCWNVEKMTGEKVALMNTYQEAIKYIDQLGDHYFNLLEEIT